MLFHMFNMRYTNTEVVMNNFQYLKSIRQKLREWKISNNITEKCVAHHRDDTPETKQYNTEHYERWGHNEDGTFEYGKYILFMTQGDHIRYHQAGVPRTEEVRKKIGEANKGRIFSDEHKKKLSIAHIGKPSPRKGKTLSDETRRKVSEAGKGRIQSEQTRQIIRDKQLAFHTKMHKLFDVYKTSGGILKYKDFCKAIKLGEISLDNFNY